MTGVSDFRAAQHGNGTRYAVVGNADANGAVIVNGVQVVLWAERCLHYCF